MLVNVELAKQFLHIDQEDTDEDGILLIIIKAAEEYLFEATGKVFTADTNRAVLYIMVLVTHWFENRELIGKSADKIQDTLNSIKYQLEFGQGVVTNASG